jgi:hypothetical protein
MKKGRWRYLFGSLLKGRFAIRQRKAQSLSVAHGRRVP